MTSEHTPEQAPAGPQPGEPIGHRRTGAVVGPEQLAGTAAGLLGDGYRVALVAGHDDGPAGGLRAVYLFTAPDPDRRVELSVHLDRDRPHVPSLAGISFTAGRFEREMRDLFGLVPDGHPLPRRMVRHAHWPQGWYPMRSDSGDPSEFPVVADPYPFRTVEGSGVYEIPVGPVHAGMIEPGHFRFSVVGETVLNLKARLWFVHRGIEKLFEGLPPHDGVEYAERVSGDTAVGHALAYSTAVEDALGVPVRAEDRLLRALLLELERIHNHVADLGALCNDVGHAILNAHAQRLRERMLRLNDSMTGHRLLRGGIHPGGVLVRRLPDVDELAAIGEDAAEIASLALGQSIVRDRFTGTAVLTYEQARDLGTLGYVARASGLDADARHGHPVPGVVLPRIQHAHTGGDVLARFSVRAEEVAASVRFAIESVRALGGYLGGPARQLLADVALPSGLRSGVGIAEGWRGTIVHRVEIALDDGEARTSRVKIVDPSFMNWPALPVAMADTIVPDFPLANKSFNLSYAGNDL
ncbi:NADH-quinone oxidoreductase subunit C [Sinomonas sp. JGH33]|uniref:NADH-quinone oxidoreductase subunit C n=1 Tax=Sinomonas terricola TaxID=3110330 RepID=A0ABU5TBP8_9MICC|nr:NADH-quinone oxidoreductase subunit C [Sinomonas sp. JGH33]MEA5457111.1 NADH-quinone oxidoreductase subunit C [Sinomonas sp. JGH33]